MRNGVCLLPTPQCTAEGLSCDVPAVFGETFPFIVRILRHYLSSLIFFCSRAGTRAVADNKPAHSIGKPAASLPTRDFTCPDGKVIKVMAMDYGFRSGAGRLYEEHYGEVPKSIFQLVGSVHLPAVGRIRCSMDTR